MDISQESREYELNVNDSRHAISGSWLGESLLYVLRERLGLYGSKNACEQGECGSCSVMMDDILVCSCLVLAANAEGREIKTIESVADGNELSDVQEAFIDSGVHLGMPRDMAHRLVLQTVLGSTELVKRTGKHPAELKDMVTSPAGTTIEALVSMENDSIRAGILNGVKKAYERAIELGE